jgi:hypothetical protein
VTDVRTATCGFVVVLAVPDEGCLSDPVVDSHEVGVLRELGDDLSRAHPLSLTCYRSDRHEAFLWGGVHPALDLVECFREVPDGKGLAVTPWAGCHTRGDVGAVRSTFYCVHVERPCWCRSRRRARWRTTRPLRCPRDIGQGLSLRALAYHW